MESSGNGHIKRILGLGLLIAILAVLVVSGVVLAVSFTASILVTEGNGTSYPMLAVNVSNNNTFLSANGYTTPNMTDVKIMIGSNEYPRMLADNMTRFAIPLNANSSQTYYYVTDQTPGDFSVIPGYGGYVTAEDKPNLEGSSNFTIQQTGWLNVTAGVSANLTTKQGAISVFVSPTVSGNVTADIGGRGVIQAQYLTGRDGADGFYGVYWDGQSTANITGMHYVMGVSLNLYRQNDPGNVTISLYQTTGSNNLPTGGVLASVTFAGGTLGTDAGGAWYDKYFTVPYYSATTKSYAIVLAAPTGDATHRVFLGRDSSAPAYANGDFLLSSDSGVNWVALTTRDAVFNLYTNPGPSVSATGLSSADTTVTVNATANRQSWATGNVLSFDGADDVVNCGSGATLDALTGNITIDVWINATSMGEGSGGRILDCSKITLNLGGANKAVFSILVGGVSKTAQTAASAIVFGTNQHITAVFNGANVLIYSGNTLVTGDATAGPIDSPAAQTWYIGDRSGSDRCFNGIIGSVRIYNVAASATTIANRGNGDYSDRTGLVAEYYLDAGSGTTITDYSGNSNTGTLTNGTWQTATHTSGLTGRLCDFTLQVGTQKWGKNLKGASVPNTDANWEFIKGNVMPYVDSISVSVNGTQQLWYQPNDMIDGTVLPDRAADATDNPGTFHWGSMSTGVVATFGSIDLTEEAYAAGAALAPPSSLGIVGYGIPAIHVPDTSLTLPGHELYPVVRDVATLTDIPIVMYWWFIAALLALLALTFAGKFTQSTFVGGVAMVVVMAVFCVLGESSTATGGCLEWWQPAVVVMGTIVTAVMERSQSF